MKLVTNIDNLIEEVQKTNFQIKPSHLALGAGIGASALLAAKLGLLGKDIQDKYENAAGYIHGGLTGATDGWYYGQTYYDAKHALSNDGNFTDRIKSSFDGAVDGARVGSEATKTIYHYVPPAVRKGAQLLYDLK